MSGLSERDKEIGIIYNFLGNEFPRALMSPSDDLDIDDELRLHATGLGLARINEDGNIFTATYVRDHEHPAVIALRGISAAEIHGLIPEGSHDQAIDAVLLGLPGPLDEFIARQTD